jgi:hypothetical protein
MIRLKIKRNTNKSAVTAVIGMVLCASVRGRVTPHRKSSANRVTSLQKVKPSIIGFVLCVALLGALTGCVGNVDGSRHSGVYVRPPLVLVEAGVVAQDDYVYYPSYQIYYNGNRRQYIYLKGRSWVMRPAPPRVSADVLVASPSVRLDFHDSPAIHHATVVQTYPKNWTPTGSVAGFQE